MKYILDEDKDNSKYQSVVDCDQYDDCEDYDENINNTFYDLELHVFNIQERLCYYVNELGLPIAEYMTYNILYAYIFNELNF